VLGRPLEIIALLATAAKAVRRDEIARVNGIRPGSGVGLKQACQTTPSVHDADDLDVVDRTLVRSA
jgi:hypothetical protein